MSRDTVYRENTPSTPTDIGYPRGFHDLYVVGKLLGKGGSGVVRSCVRKQDGNRFAVKKIPKVLDDPTVSKRKRDAQIPSIKNEVQVLLALRGNLNIAALEAVYEDDDFVYLVIELCTGGKLLQGRAGPGTKVLSEKLIAAYLRAILKTVAQCHSRNILHRDIKPENFLHAFEDDPIPLKAIDFGLAMFCAPSSLPVTAPNAEGTPWYLAPESCRGKWWPASDVWSCGIMAAYMLTGKYPFVDRICPDMPDLARTLKEICFSELDLSSPEWKRVSPAATDFVKFLLVKEVDQRPSALEALNHPFLSEEVANSNQPLHRTVVQRIQRFAQSGIFKRRILEHIAVDLVKMHFASELQKSEHSNLVFKDRSVKGGKFFLEERKERSDCDAQRKDTNNESSHRYGDPSYHAAKIIQDSIKKLKITNEARSEAKIGELKPQSSDPDHSTANGSAAAKPVPSGIYLPIATPYSRRLAVVLDSIDIDRDGRVNRKDLIESLEKLGYHLNNSEAMELFDAIDVERKGHIACAELSASLIDWKYLQDTFKDRWIESVRRVFEDLDKDGDGNLDTNEVAAAFMGHLDEYEVDAAVHQALLESFVGDRAEIDFDHFMKLLQSGEYLGDLELYDDRINLNRRKLRHSPNRNESWLKRSFKSCFNL